MMFNASATVEQAWVLNVEEVNVLCMCYAYVDLPYMVCVCVCVCRAVYR